MEKELTLKTLIEGGRDIKNFSQRELARRIGLSNTSLNDLEDEFKNKSSRDLKNIIKEARIFKYDILDWDSNKRESTRIVMENLFRISHKLEILNNHPEFDYSIEKAIEEINQALKDLEPVAKKYDYSKLPKDL